MPASAQNSRARRAALIERFLDGFAVRVVLSVAIIASLIPIPWLERFDLVFLTLFAAEFGARLVVVAGLNRAAGPAESLGARAELDRTPLRLRPAGQASARVLLLLDFLALVSFVPVPVGVAGARWLRVFRLTRMLLLVGYWAPIVRDLYGIVARRERARQVGLMGVVVAGLSFAGAVIIHHLGDAAIDTTDDGVVNAADRNFLNLLWWSFRQVQDPGNMLHSPLALPVVLTSVFLTVFGLFLVSFLIGLGTDVMHELLEFSRLRPPGLRGHSVVVNIGPSTQRLLYELMRYYRKLFFTDARVLSREWLRDLRRRGLWRPRYLIVGQGSEPPDFVRQPELRTIVYRQHADDEEELIHRSDLLSAKRIVLMADLEDDTPDAETIRTLLTLVERVRDREREFDTRLSARRQRVVIAEILDESNVSAAQASFATGEGSFRGFVVPTEKLLALFFASVIRRPGLGYVLEELLTSRGHEIYTCFFDTPGLSFSLEDPPALGPGPGGAIDALLAHGLRPGRDRGTIIPLGLLVDQPALPGERDFEVDINPARGGAGTHHYRGVVAVADNFRSIRTFAETIPRTPDATHLPGPPGEFVLPRLQRTHRSKTTRVLVCGFRPASLYMLEELVRSDPTGSILVLVESRDAKRRALEAMQAHTEHVRHGFLHSRHCEFEPQNEAGLVHVYVDRDQEPSPLWIRVADWMASRHLVELPISFGHVADLDVIVFVASDRQSADKRTATALLKLEQLCQARAPTKRPRVVAEVFDGRLALRLEQRYFELGIRDVRVFSIQELRAYFLFQSVVVPGFDAVYAELMGSWGQSFVHKDIEGSPRGPCSFVALALHLRRLGEILVAVEVADADGRPVVCVAPTADEAGTSFALEDLRGVWVIAPDSGRTAPDARTRASP